MCGLRGRCVHIAEHASTRRDHCPRSGTRDHQAGTLPDMREHCAAGSAPGFAIRPPAGDEGQVVPQPPRRGRSRPPTGHLKTRRTATGPADHRRSRMRADRGETAPRLVKTRGDRAGEDPSRGEARRAAVKANHLQSPARWLRNVPTLDPKHPEARRGTPKPSHDGPHPRLRCAVNSAPSPGLDPKAPHPRAWTRRRPIPGPGPEGDPSPGPGPEGAQKGTNPGP